MRRAEALCSVGNSTLYIYYNSTKIHEIKPKKVKALLSTKANPYLDDALGALVHSGRLNRLLGKFGDDISENIFEVIMASFSNIKVK